MDRFRADGQAAASRGFAACALILGVLLGAAAIWGAYDFSSGGPGRAGGLIEHGAVLAGNARYLLDTFICFTFCRSCPG